MAILTPSASVLTIEIDQNAWENTDNKNEISASQDMSSYAILFEHDTQKTQVVTVRIFEFLFQNVIVCENYFMAVYKLKIKKRL